MGIRLTVLLLLWGAWAMVANAQDVDPQAYYVNSEGDSVITTSIDDGQAPLAVSFKANPTDMGYWKPSFEWHFSKRDASAGETELFVRYEEDTDFTFVESGTYTVVLKTSLRNGDDVAELDAKTLTVTIAESVLVFPNAFSPNNGDDKNNIYRAKEYKSIVSFKAIIVSRTGQKLYEWTDPAGGWDGKYRGHDVKQGVYFVYVHAKGADGVEYNIRKDVNLLRGYRE